MTISCRESEEIRYGHIRLETDREHDAKPMTAQEEYDWRVTVGQL